MLWPIYEYVVCAVWLWVNKAPFPGASLFSLKSYQSGRPANYYNHTDNGNAEDWICLCPLLSYNADCTMRLGIWISLTNSSLRLSSVLPRGVIQELGTWWKWWCLGQVHGSSVTWMARLKRQLVILGSIHGSFNSVLVAPSFWWVIDQNGVWSIYDYFLGPVFIPDY